MKQRLAPWLFLSCTLVAAIWLVLAHRSSRPFEPFTLAAPEFIRFTPDVANWTFSNIPVTSIDPAEPNIMTLAATRPANTQAPSADTQPLKATIRLVHGYNMPMCMKIKGFTVELVKDSAMPVNHPSSIPLRIQYWRVTSSTGKTSLWLTSMLRSGDFTPTGEDICTMAFPRVDIPDDPRWVPGGLTLEDLRHPIMTYRRWFQIRWNASRTDLLTFLRLKQPAWASNEQLSYITIGHMNASPDENREETLRQLRDLHVAVLGNLQTWSKTKHL